MRILTTIALTASLAASASAQAPDRTARDARLTCELLADIIAPSRARGDAPIYVSRFFATNPSDEPFRIESLADFIRLQGDGNPWGVTPTWEAAFGQLRASVVAEAWAAWNAGGPVSCPDLTEVQWTTREAFESVSRHVANTHEAAQYVGPSRPGVPAQPEVPYPTYFEISRPAFDEFGHRALVIQDLGTLSTIYEFRDGHWQAEAFNLLRSH
tara:strand:- start:13885 stop:14523 length:639 start_codon:yes stop_codon:yes gene_type:complete